MALSGVQRIAKFVKYLPQFGYEPVVLTVEPRGYFAFDDGLADELKEQGIEIHRTQSKDPTRLFKSKKQVAMPSTSARSIASWMSSFLFIPDNKKGWRNFAVNKGKELLSNNDFDLIFSSAPPYTAHLIGVELSKFSGLPLVCDFRDDWVGNPRHIYPTGFHRSKHQKMEVDVLKYCKKATVINRKIMEALVDRTLGPSGFNKVVVIPQGFDPSDMDLTPMPRLHKKLILCYAGIFYHAQSPENFFKGLAMAFRARPDLREHIEARFVGHLSEAELKSANLLGLKENISYDGYLNHEDTVRHLLGSDVLWMTVGNQIGGESISTGKLFEYFGTRKPILGLVPEGAAKDALSGYGASKVVNPDDLEGIAEAILDFYEGWKNDRLASPDEDFVQKHSRDRLAEDLAGIFSTTLLNEQVF